MLVSTGSRPRVPDFAPVDRDRVLTTRDAYPPPEIPEHAIVIGSGVTGVEFTHLFQSLGSQVTLLVSRQQVLPIKDPEVAAVLEESFLDVGVNLLKGARADSITRDGDVVRVHCDDGREITGSHVLLAVGSIPNTEGIGLEDVGVEVDDRGCIRVNHNCLSNVPGIYAAGDVSGKLPLSSVAAMQGRKIAEHLMGLHNRPHRHLDYEKAASAVFTDPEIADVGLAEAEAFSGGRKIRVTKVPFSSNPKALIKGDAARLREDPLRPRHGCGARRLDRRAFGGRAHQRDRARGHQRPQGRRHRRLPPRAPDPRRVVGRGRQLAALIAKMRFSPARPTIHPEKRFETTWLTFPTSSWCTARGPTVRAGAE